MKKKPPPKFDLEGYGLDEKQRDFLYEMLTKALSIIDDRDQHFTLFVLTREGQTEEEHDIVSTSIITTMDKEFLQETMRTWLHKETQ